MGAITVNTNTNMTALPSYDTNIHYGWTKNNYDLSNVNSIRSITIGHNNDLAHIHIKTLITFDDGLTYQTWDISSGFNGEYTPQDAWDYGIDPDTMVTAVSNIIINGTMSKIGFAFAYKTDQSDISYDPPQIGPIKYIVANNDILSKDNVNTLGNDLSTIISNFDNIDTRLSNKIKFVFGFNRENDTDDLNISKFGFNKHQIVYGSYGSIEDFSNYFGSNQIDTNGYSVMNIRFKIWRDMGTTDSPKLKSFNINTKDNKFYTNRNVFDNYTVRLIDNDLTEIVKNSIGARNVKVSIIY